MQYPVDKTKRFIIRTETELDVFEWGRVQNWLFNDDGRDPGFADNIYIYYYEDIGVPSDFDHSAGRPKKILTVKGDDCEVTYDIVPWTLEEKTRIEKNTDLASDITRIPEAIAFIQNRIAISDEDMSLEELAHSQSVIMQMFLTIFKIVDKHGSNN